MNSKASKSILLKVNIVKEVGQNLISMTLNDYFCQLIICSLHVPNSGTHSETYNVCKSHPHVFSSTPDSPSPLLSLLLSFPSQPGSEDKSKHSPLILTVLISFSPVPSLPWRPPGAPWPHCLVFVVLAGYADKKTEKTAAALGSCAGAETDTSDQYWRFVI